ncbi:hypothetical protein GLA29479_3429 [Lysobacter antibioticus]|nr:hypothetical protein GLA29479_3429 [Lysobacter antibioticus]
MGHPSMRRTFARVGAAQAATALRRFCGATLKQDPDPDPDPDPDQTLRAFATKAAGYFLLS